MKRLNWIHTGWNTWNLLRFLEMNVISMTSMQMNHNESWSNHVPIYWIDSTCDRFAASACLYSSLDLIPLRVELLTNLRHIFPQWLHPTTQPLPHIPVSWNPESGSAPVGWATTIIIFFVCICTHIPWNSYCQNILVVCVGTSLFGRFFGNQAFHKKQI